ncbi:ATP-binding protein [Nonomuraea sp. NPDC049028]|uniref:ATP-binding protein n=1 Tax=Nonomuraea sp. NPDC049028 TaxID=3364348 RepID=UPI00371DBA84
MPRLRRETSTASRIRWPRGCRPCRIYGLVRRESRHFTRYLLSDAPCQDDAEQIVAELGANALQHTGSGRHGGTFIVEFTRTTVTTTVAVYDCGWGGCPRFGMACRTTAECGRGLALVTAIADQVGCEGDKEVGHRVWAKIHTNPCP